MTILDAARDGMNPDIRPQDDLFGHVNGRWLEETEIPSDKSSWGAFIALADAAEQQVRDIITELADRPRDELDEDDELEAEIAALEAIKREKLGIAAPVGEQKTFINNKAGLLASLEGAHRPTFQFVFMCCVLLLLPPLYSNPRAIYPFLIPPCRRRRHRFSLDE